MGDTAMVCDPNQLRLPKICLMASPTVIDSRICTDAMRSASLFAGSQASRKTRSSFHGSGIRPAGKRSLEDFLGPSLHVASSSGRRGAARARPTQRQPIDDETTVPAELFERMLALGCEARARATHVTVFDPKTGRPRAVHHDAAAIVKRRAGRIVDAMPFEISSTQCGAVNSDLSIEAARMTGVEVPTGSISAVSDLAVVSLPPRQSLSSCALEAAEAREPPIFWPTCQAVA